MSGIRDILTFENVLHAAFTLSSILVIAYSILSNNILYLAAGLLLFISMLLWRLFFKSSGFDPGAIRDCGNCRLLNALFFATFALSMLALAFNDRIYERPLVYYALIIISYLIIFFSILYGSSAKAILLKIILTSISFSWSELMIYPGLIGIDPWYHQTFANNIISTGRILSEYSYTYLPAFHLMISGTSLVTGFDYKISSMMSVSLLQVVCNTLFAYIVTYLMFNNRKLGLIAALMLAISNYSIFMSYWIIPNGFAAVFIIFVIYLTIKYDTMGKTVYLLIIALVLVLAILSHTIVTLFLLLVLAVTYMLSLIHRINPRKRTAIFIILVAYLASFILYWTLVSGSIDILLDVARVAIRANPLDRAGVPGRVLQSGYELIMANFGMYLFFSLSLIGVLYMISRRGSHITRSFAIIGLIPLAISFFSIFLKEDSLTDRWWFISELLLSIPLSVTLYMVFQYMNDRVNRYATAIMMLLVSLTLVAFMVLSPQASIDNDTFTPNTTVRFALTQSEIDSINHAVNVSKIPIMTDDYYASTVKYRRYVFTFDNLSVQRVYGLKNFYLLVRDEIFNRPSFESSRLKFLDEDIKRAFDNHSRVYSSGPVQGYVPAGYGG